jgi:glutamate synthase domain-containing protein 2
MTRKNWQHCLANRKPIDQGGLLKFVFGKEYHAFNPDVINSLHKAVRSGQYQDFKEYAELVNNRPVATIRDLFKLKTTDSIAIDQVETIEDIYLVLTLRECLWVHCLQKHMKQLQLR